MICSIQQAQMILSENNGCLMVHFSGYLLYLLTYRTEQFGAWVLCHGKKFWSALDETIRCDYGRYILGCKLMKSMSAAHWT